MGQIHAGKKALIVRASLPQVSSRRAMPIRQAVEWAFATERARLDFGDVPGRDIPEASPLYTVMRRGALGCAIDGGGSSLPAHDADMIAAVLAKLPSELGGRKTALRVAELARAGQAEDWGASLKAACIPVEWRAENQKGRTAATVLVRYERVEVRGRVREFEVRMCPVTFTATGARKAAARAAWTKWRNALAWLAETLAAQRALDRITIAPGLPPSEPWA